MTSIRQKILILITMVLVLGTGILSALIFMISKEELNDMLDESMQQVAYAVAAHQDYTQTSNINITSLENHELGEDGDFVVQIWSPVGKLLYTSHNHIKIPILRKEEGFGQIDFLNKKWRYFIKKSQSKTIQILGTIEEREEDILETVITFLIPIFLQFPCIILLVYFATNKSLQPLYSLSKIIERRDSFNLTPIDMEKVPSEIQSIILSLNQLLSKLDKALKHQRQFIADAAHELRTPLTALQIQLENLEHSSDERERTESIESLKQGISRSVRLVINLLALSREDPDYIKIKMEKIDLRTILKAAHNEYLSFAKDKKMQLKLNLGVQDVFILGEAQSLQIMIGNILHNAILYTPEYGLVSMSLQVIGESAVVIIKDNGPGIPEEEHSRIFDRFYRVLGTKKSGSGLGLSIAKVIAERHKAHITLAPGSGKIGTHFEILFPEKIV